MRGQAPRHLRAAILPFSVHAQNWPQAAPAQAGKGINTIKKIVQICALLCSTRNRVNQVKKPQNCTRSGCCNTGRNEHI
ncbi:hypothetical protein FE839_14960 [Klebsiella indica]|uniref:Uncharacterized protein n=1 Tax=Klebsiella indica TaxID=2582917 RepID=A0A5R9LFF0_9ENTR|nr:hypothetical protein FE839_14960 [Klebsiella indica]